MRLQASYIYIYIYECVLLPIQLYTIYTSKEGSEKVYIVC